MIFYSRLGCLLLVMICSSKAVGAAESGLDRLRDAVHRRDVTVKSGHLTLLIQRKSSGQETPTYEAHFEMWFDKSQLRSDQLLSHDARDTKCYGCYEENKFVDYNSTPRPDGGVVMASVRDEKYLNATDKVILPRYIGLVPTFFQTASQFPIEGVLTAREGTKVMSSEASLRGVQCQMLEWDAIYPRTHFRCWSPLTAPEKIIQIEQEWMNGAVTIIERNVIEYAETAAIDNPIPHRVRYTRDLGSGVSEEEILEVTFIELNKPVPAITFSLSGIPGVTDKTPIQWVSDDPRPDTLGLLLWDGKNVVSARADNSKSSDLTVRPRWILWGNGALILGGVIIFLLRRRMRSL